MMRVVGRGVAALGATPLWRRALYAQAALGGVYTVLVGGTVLTGLVLWAGGGAFELGLLSALTTGGGLTVLAIRRVQRRIRSHKRLTRLAWAVGWASWLPLAALLAALAALGAAGRGVVVPLLLATAFASAALAGLGNVSWSGWLSRLVAGGGRGGFLAQQARAASLTSLAALPVVGLVLDRSRLDHHEALGFAVVLAAPALCAAAGWQLLAGVPTGRHEATAAGAGRGERQAGGIGAGRLAAYTVVWQVAVYLGAPFFQAYALGRLGLSFSLLMNLQVLSQVIPILTLGWWGRIIDRMGVRVPLGVCSLGKALVPVCYLVATPEAWWPILGAYLLSVADAGIGIANGAAYARVAEGRDGSARVAHLSVLTSLAASATPVLAGLAVANLRLGTLDTLALLFALSAIGRALAGGVLLAPERRGRVIRVIPPARPGNG